VLKPSEGRNRVVVEGVQPEVECGRFPVKRIVGDMVEVSAAVYGDGHDHVAARVLYRKTDAPVWKEVRLKEVGNDLWQASFPVDTIGSWQFKVQGWVDHFDTWRSDLAKRIAAQPATTGIGEISKDIPLAFLTGALLLDAASLRAKGADAQQLKGFASSLRWLAGNKLERYDDPLTEEIAALVDKYPDLAYVTEGEEMPLWVDRERARFSSWYEFFPRSSGPAGKHGTLRDAAKLLPNLGQMGFDVIYFPPIHPVGTAFRKGKNNSTEAAEGDVGSPWAIGNTQGGHTEIAPELGTFADFDALVVAARQSGVEIALDIAFQCSPDHPWVKKHPEWFSIRPDRTIQYAENPPKKYQDIYPLNFESSDWQGLWNELAGVFLFWTKRGVRIFRVDNPHTKALPFWDWCLSRVQEQYPDAIFLAEAFTRPHVMYGLAKRGFSQSYTYFTWRETKEEITEYMTEITTEPVRNFFRGNLWPNTPDILPGSLKIGGRAAFALRAVLAATLGANYGVYGPAFELMDSVPVKPGSEEYLDSEKYQLREWNRASEDSLMPFLGKLNWSRKLHPALQRDDTLHFHPIDNPKLLCYSKQTGMDVLLMIVNLDLENPQSAWTNLPMAEFGFGQDEKYSAHDLLTDAVFPWSGPHNYVLLDPQQMPAHVLHLQRVSTEQDQQDGVSA